MKHITDADFQLKQSAVALGKFEGLHRGHQLLFDKINEQKAKGLSSVVFTFDMPPRNVLAGDLSFKQLFTRQEKARILEEKGIDVLVEYPFTKEFASMLPEEFIKSVLVDQLDTRVLVVGTDYRFGRKRSGSVEDLKKYADVYGYRLIIMDKLQMTYADVSSSRIRDCLSGGRMEELAGMLGRPFSITGEVVHGRALGRTIDIPTANVEIPDRKMMPPNGVYVARILMDGETYYGISNVGTKPTVKSDGKMLIETNIFSFSGDIYGKIITVELLHYRRPEMKFCSVEELKAQMSKDKHFGMEYILKEK